MPFARPSLDQLIAAFEADVAARLPGADAALRRSNLNVLARVQSGVSHGLYGFIDWAKDQLLADTAEAEMLDRHGAIWGIARIAATFAGGSVDLTGTTASIVPAGTVFQRADGVQFASTADVTIVAGVASAAIAAVVAGIAGNTVAATGLNMIAPIAGVTSSATVAVGGLVGGVDQESDTDLRVRILDRIQTPPHGGADFDYVKWAIDQAGVTRAWAYPQELGLGTVTVRFMMDGAYTDGLPLAADVTAVLAALNIVRPVTADLTVVAPIAKVLNPNIGGLAPATPAVKTAIEAELKDLIRREAAPGATLLISHIREAISIAAGETNHVLVSPVADVVHATSEIAVFGAITWS